MNRGCSIGVDLMFNLVETSQVRVVGSKGTLSSKKKTSQPLPHWWRGYKATGFLEQFFKMLWHWGWGLIYGSRATLCSSAWLLMTVWSQSHVSDVDRFWPHKHLVWRDGDSSPKTQPGRTISGTSDRFTSPTWIGPLVSTRARAIKMPPNYLGTGSRMAQGPCSQDPWGIPPHVTSSRWAGIFVTSRKTKGTEALPHGFRVTSQINHRSFTHNHCLELTCISSAPNTSQPNSRLSVIGQHGHATWTLSGLPTYSHEQHPYHAD